MLAEDVDVGDNQADNHHGLEGDQAPEVVYLGEGVAAALAAVAQVVQDHHHNHQHSIANGEDVERCSPNVFGSYVEVKIALGMKRHLKVKMRTQERKDRHRDLWWSWTTVMMLGYLKTGLVMVVVEELVDDEESRPVSAARKQTADLSEGN